MFAQWWGDVLVQSVIFVQRFVSGTGCGFENRINRVDLPQLAQGVSRRK